MMIVCLLAEYDDSFALSQVVYNGTSVTMTTEELVILDHQAKESLDQILKMSNLYLFYFMQ